MKKLILVLLIFVQKEAFAQNRLNKLHRIDSLEIVFKNWRNDNSICELERSKLIHSMNISPSKDFIFIGLRKKDIMKILGEPNENQLNFLNYCIGCKDNCDCRMIIKILFRFGKVNSFIIKM